MFIKRILCLGLLLGFAFSSPTAFGQEPDAKEGSQRKNVLFLISDDLNTRIGCYGDPIVQTPNIDRLAARGVLFENAACQYPLCGPSRNSMLCGLYPDTTGIHGNAQIFRDSIPQRWSLPQAFRLDGYFAGRIGKLYHYNVPKSVGTNGHDDPASWELELNPAGCDRLIEEPDIFTLRKGAFGGTLSWYASPRPDEAHTDGMLADDASWVLERCAKRNDRPFFLAVGFYRPHTPYVAPKGYFEPYKLEDMPLFDNVEEDNADVPAAALLSKKKEQDQLNDELRRQAIQAYYASTTFMDAQVGKVLDTLKRTGLDKNTIVVFTSDHGYFLGEKGLWQKQALFDKVAGVPLIIAEPGRTEGAIAKSPVGLVDLYPTLAELCDVPTQELMQGQSLVPMLRDPSETGRGYSMSMVARNDRQAKQRYFGYSIRTERYRLTLWDDGKRGTELYDHQNDPDEFTNLAHGERKKDPNNAKVIRELTQKLKAEMAKGMPASGKRTEYKVGNWNPMLRVDD
ncbi:sulfatase [Rhodopirellula europaea]|uniref:Iduronate-2-sulfatase n=1 Tax=Rhodopirellula europaea SH398 TaxID=1263868 RepID=M5SJ55_9BACT|nr:sulfatase [Rhodopirellula europaea]EMI26234.1 iduronate-2-sulfatase [Rhodopirellula europaea SH398]